MDLDNVNRLTAQLKTINLLRKKNLIDYFFKVPFLWPKKMPKNNKLLAPVSKLLGFSTFSHMQAIIIFVFYFLSLTIQASIFNIL